MAAGKEIKVTVKTEYDGKGAKKALEDVDKLDKASPIEIPVEVSNVLKALDQVAAATKETKAAADALAMALGPELAAKADTMSIVADMQRAGLTIEDITTNADVLGNKLRELSDIDVGGKMGRNLGTARGKLDDLGRSADSSKSVLANMTGNATQDLGALAGLSGSAGVAIGQMGEYMADAANSGEKLGSILGNFATVAGPIALIALAMKSLSDIQARFAASQERSATTQEQWNEALLAGGNAADSYAANLTDVGKITLDVTREQSKLQNVLGELDSHWYTGGVGVKLLGEAFGVTNEETKDLTGSFADAGIKVDQFTSAVTGTASDQQRFIDAVKATKLPLEEQNAIIDLLTQSIADYELAQRNAAAFEAVFAGAGSANFGHAPAAGLAAIREANLESSAAATAKSQARINNTIINPPGTPAATFDQLDTFLGRNSARTEG